MYVPKSSNLLVRLECSYLYPALFLAFFGGIIKKMGRKSQVTTNDTYIFRSCYEMDNSCCQEIQASETILIFFLYFSFPTFFKPHFRHQLHLTFEEDSGP